MNIQHLMKILPVIQAFSHLGGDSLDEAQKAQSIGAQQQMQPYTLENMMNEAKMNAAKAQLTGNQAQDYQADRTIDLQNKALEGAGQFMRGSGYLPNSGKMVAGVLPQLLQRAGVDPGQPSGMESPQDTANRLAILQFQAAKNANNQPQQ